MFALTCALLAVTMAAVSNAGLVTLTADQKQAILDAHNKLRAQTANGLTAGQPGAANMPALEWDDRLMNSAANWVQGCVAGHDTGDARALAGYGWVGQNWAGGYSSDFTTYVQMWFGEYKDFNFDSNTCKAGAMCGHYTQVVWAKTTLVGCAASTCTNYPYNFVCNYAFGGNYNGELPYVKGTAGTKCQGDYSLNQRGLCLRGDQCTGSDCVCTLTSCANGGTLDSTNCVCKCADGFYGDKCESVCADTDVKTDQWICTASNCKDYFAWASPKCPKTCGICKKSMVRDQNVLNPDKVKARCP